MIEKKILEPKRVRRIDGGFSYIPHRFLTDGFLSSLSQKELLLYLFLVLVSDRHGLSYYSYDAICSLLQLSVDEYMEARDGLMEKDLIAFDGTIFQVLDLPSEPVQPVGAKLVPELDRAGQRPTIKNFIQQSLWEDRGGR
ncbi:MAG: helix-turn-helix domain-containing protein [Candidatus Hydrothermarchaeales archaeon]